ncbi:hypothetical protein ES703_67990 [subsurface metagenome]
MGGIRGFVAIDSPGFYYPYGRFHFLDDACGYRRGMGAEEHGVLIAPRLGL